MSLNRGSVLRQEHYGFFSRILICKATYFFFVLLHSMLHVTLMLFLHTVQWIKLYFSGSCSFCDLIVIYLSRNPKNTNVVESMVKALARVVSSIQVGFVGQVDCNVSLVSIFLRSRSRYLICLRVGFQSTFSFFTYFVYQKKK